ncbi:hypothetical protein KR100_14425 [Synechococcus sp. KORDI-100]|uniref:DUF3120 domain-containing protein n=1 Tax=Synechococcus sp. KORDI-100 TaxID=1280380 RepID=UPI0004E041C5|nr:DUF3120 domain-containing protein [Synechococcus sp. KORDI-100]AII44540.1 hypothetical protein KR100_14425 [Synechococcus sp. KORDI-100]
MAVPQTAAALVVLPVFLQAPWVRLHPFTATLFTIVLLTVGLNLQLNSRGMRAEIGSLLVGFSGSWLAGCLFWGWLRAHPLLHLPIEAFALPLAVTGLNSRWRLACGFYLSSLLGTACTDLMMLATGVMPFWPQVVSAPLHEAGLQLHYAANQLMKPQSLILLASAASGILLTARLLRQRTPADPDVQDVSGMAASVLTTTLWVDGLFLAAALLQPGLSGLI